MALDPVCCAIAELLNQGFGDPVDSKGGTQTVGTSYISIVTVSRPAVLTMKNTGAVDMEVGATPDTTGQIVSAGSTLVLDRFKGTLYARATAGTSTLNWYAWLANVNVI